MLFVSAYDPRTGVVTAYRNISRGLSGQVEFDAYGFTGWLPDSPFHDFCRRLYGPERTLAEVLVAERYDVVHAIDTAYEPPFGVDTWLQRARFRGGVVLMSQNAAPVLTVPPVFPHIAVACSDGTRSVLKRHISGPIRVVPNGVDVEIFAPAPGRAGRLAFVWVGRSSDSGQKDLASFIVAAERHRQYDWIVVDVESDPSLRAHPAIQYRSRLTQPELARVFRDVAASHGAIISTSRYEGLPFALIEAAACGLPVIAPRIPGHEYLTDDVTALLYHRTPDMLGIDEALVRLPARRLQLARAGLAMVLRDYTVKSMGEGYLDAYQAALAEGSAAARPTDWPVRTAWMVALRIRKRIRGVWPRASALRGTSRPS